MIFKNTINIYEDALFSKECKNPVYIVLMHSGTPLANIIKKVTGDEFSHACISFNSKLDPLYSFGSKGEKESGIGFAVNNPIDRFFFQYSTKYSVYVMYVSDMGLKAMKNRLKYFEDNRDKLKYDFKGLFDIWFGKESEDHEKWFCSRFVMELISKVNKLEKVPSLWKPSDITQLQNISLVNRGFNFINYDHKVTDRHCNDIKKGRYNVGDVIYENDNDHIDCFVGNTIQEAISSKVIDDYESKQDMQLSSFSKMKLNDMVLQVYKKQYPSLSHVRVNNSTKGFIWLDGDNLVGILNTEEKDDDYKWIISFEIFGDYKGHGLSKQMLKVAIRELGVTNLSVNKSNEIAIKLYKSFGFKKYKETESMYFMTISKYDDINEAADPYSSDGLYYLTTGDYNDLENEYHKWYKSIKFKFGLPNCVDKDLLEKLVIAMVDSMMKGTKHRNGGDYPFKFYEILMIPESDLRSLIVSSAGPSKVFSAKIYQYNFSKDKRRYSLILIANERVLYTVHILKPDNELIDITEKYNRVVGLLSESSNDILDKTVSILQDNGYKPNIDSKSKSKFLAGEETDFGKSLCIANLGNGNLSGICSKINKEIKPIGGKVKPDNYGTIFLSITESESILALMDKNTQTHYVPNDYKMTAEMARQKLNQLRQQNKMMFCSPRDIESDDGGWVFAEYTLESLNDRDKLVLFINFINKIIETSIYCGSIEIPKSLNKGSFGLLSISETHVYDVSSESGSINNNKKDIKFYKNPAKQLKIKNTKKKNDNTKLGNYFNNK